MRGNGGAFAACSFWLVEALVHVGRVDEARRRFEAAMHLCNDVRHLSEEIDPPTDDLLGNFPKGL